MSPSNLRDEPQKDGCVAEEFVFESARRQRTNKLMLIREVKLKPTAKQSKVLGTALWQMVSVYNTALTKCFIGLRAGCIPTSFDLMAEFTGHGKRR